MKPALISFQITKFFYYALGVLLIILGLTVEQGAGLLFMAPFAIGLGFAMSRIRKGLTEGKYWAWIAGIVASGFCTFSILFPLGIMGFIGLLNKETRQAFASQG